MSKLRYAILIVCLVVSQWALAQKRYLASERWEYRLSQLAGITTNKKTGGTDLFWGLHKSQYVGSHHLVGFSFEGAWSSFANNMPNASISPGGHAFGMHLLYEYQYSGILFQTGIGVNHQLVFTRVNDADFYHVNVYDKWEPIEHANDTLKHEFRHRTDMSRMIYGQIPLYVGHYILGPSGVGYWLAGFHANYALTGYTKQRMTGSTLAKYDPFLGVWHEMDNHGYRKDVPIVREGEQLKLNLDVMLHGEIGYELTSFNGPHNYRRTSLGQQDFRFRFAAFADFGILNICPRTDNVLYGIPEQTIYDFPTYRMDHIFSTSDAKNFWMRNLFVGIRITILYGFPVNDQCILCYPDNRY